MLSLKCAVTVPPKTNELSTSKEVVCPLIEIEDNVFAGVESVTVTVQVPFLVVSTVDVAVIVVVPTPTAVTVPLLTVAIEELPVDQVTV